MHTLCDLVRSRDRCTTIGLQTIETEAEVLTGRFRTWDVVCVIAAEEEDARHEQDNPSDTGTLNSDRNHDKDKDSFAVTVFDVVRTDNS